MYEPINKKTGYKTKLINKYIYIGYFFPKQLGLDERITSWDLKNRIPRRKLRIQSYSQVSRSKSRPKYLKIYFSYFFWKKNRALKLRFLAFSRGPGGFRELREAGRNHFHLSWYLFVPGVTSYDQKPWGGTFSSGHETWGLRLLENFCL